MKDDNRFAGLGAEALNEAERESVVQLALVVMAGEVARGPLMSSEADTARYLQLKAGRRRREVFGCLFLTTRHCLIRDEELFYGSIDRTTVHPRVILQKALAYNAAAVIAYHNHPSGVEEPSLSDMSLTSRTKDLLQEIEVRLLDHIVVPRFRDRQHGRPRPDLTHRGPGAAH